jgi:hypothetical protein
MADIGLVSERITSIRTSANVTLRDPPPDRGSIVISSDASAKTVQQVIGSGSTSTTRYKMRAIETGGGCVGVVYRVWEAVGTPDLTGAQYVGTRCVPPGTFTDATILEIYE